MVVRLEATDVVGVGLPDRSEQVVQLVLELGPDRLVLIYFVSFRPTRRLHKMVTDDG